MTDNIDRRLEVKFSSTVNTYSKITLNKTVSNFKPKAEITPVEKDIYYDEIVYYDGGDVNGYGDS